MAYLSPARVSGVAKSRAQLSVVGNVPAPVGGLNARDGLTAMAPNDAVILNNWFPEAQYCVTRRGSISWATGLGGPVRSLMTWRSMTGADRLFGAAVASIYNVTSAGAVGAAAVAGLTSVDFQWTNITTSAGSYLFAVNGADLAYTYDGTAWANPAIAGVASSTLINVVVFKERLWFAQKNTLTAWYLPTASIAGTAVAFPLGAVFRMGGSIAALGTFSSGGEAGTGPDDYLAIVTTNGEVAVYEGVDPASSNTFGLAGLYSVGKPIGRRCTARLNGDLGIVTADGMISMQAALKFDRASEQNATITGKIQTLFGDVSRQYSGNTGWQAFVYPKARYLIVNYPVITNTTQYQFVMNTVTGAWCTFSGLNAGCWATANDLLFFGGNSGVVYQADTVTADVGADIVCDMLTSFSVHELPQKKMITAIKPIVLSGGGVDFQNKINWDFDTTAPTGTITALPTTGSVWGAMFWPWTWGGLEVDARWHAAGGIGTWAGVRFKVAANGTSVQVNAFNVLIQPGGPL